MRSFSKPIKNNKLARRFMFSIVTQFYLRSHFKEFHESLTGFPTISKHNDVYML